MCSKEPKMTEWERIEKKSTEMSLCDTTCRGQEFYRGVTKKMSQQKSIENETS